MPRPELTPEQHDALVKLLNDPDSMIVTEDGQRLYLFYRDLMMCIRAREGMNFHRMTDDQLNEYAFLELGRWKTLRISRLASKLN